MKWDLTVLYKEGFADPRLEADFVALEQGIPAFLAAMKAAVPGRDDRGVLDTAIEQLSFLTEKANLAEHLIFLTLSTDATNKDALSRQDRMQKIQLGLKQCQSALSRFLGEVENLDEVIRGDALLEAHAFNLREWASNARHQYPEALEKTILDMQRNGGLAWVQLRDMLDGTHTVDFTFNGKTEKLSLAAIRALAYDPDPAKRKAAYECELEGYKKIEIPMAACLNGFKGEALTLAPLRGYESPLDMTLAFSRMDRQTLEAMLEAMREALPMFRKYLRAKGRLLGHEDGLPFYDLFAPMGKIQKTYTLEEAHQYLVRVMKSFSDEMSAFIDRAFNERWIDAYPYEGKGGGAFCSGIYAIRQSRVLANFGGSFSDVSTLAHELGHGYHGRCIFSEPILTCDYPMPLAETASIFNETLLSGAALKDANDEEAFALLEGSVMEATQVIVDIMSRYLFETEVFRRRADHKLTVDELKEIMLWAQEQTYGDGLAKDARHPYMWACKCHYYMVDQHFYNFPYAFGLLFGKGVYALYQQKGKAFVPQYDQLLRYTGKADVAGVAASVGIDVHDVNFWRTSLKTITDQIEAFCLLAEKR